MVKLTNEQKFKTAEERCHAYYEYAEKSGRVRSVEDFAYWLAIDAEEKPEPCPFCGREVEVQSRGGEKDRRGNVYLSLVRCPHCGYTSSSSSERDSIGGIIAAHNRVARVVRAAWEGEVK